MGFGGGEAPPTRVRSLFQKKLPRGRGPSRIRGGFLLSSSPLPYHDVYIHCCAYMRTFSLLSLFAMHDFFIGSLSQVLLHRARSYFYNVHGATARFAIEGHETRSKHGISKGLRSH